METKKCSRCGRILPIDQFSKKSGSKDGHQSWCKDCIHQYLKGSSDPKSKKDEESEDKTYYPSNAVAPADETNVLEKFTPRQLLKELKRRGYRWSGMSVVMTIDYESI